MVFLSGLLELGAGENQIEISVTTTRALRALMVADFAVQVTSKSELVLAYQILRRGVLKLGISRRSRTGFYETIVNADGANTQLVGFG